MDIIGFDNQVNGWFDRFNPLAQQIKKAQQKQKQMIQQRMNQKKMNQPSKFPNISSDQKKRMIMSLVNSMSGVNEITGFDEQIGNPFKKISQRIKRVMNPAQQIKFVSRVTPTQIKKKSMVQKAIMQKKIQARNLAQIIKANTNRELNIKKPTANQLISSKVTPTLVKSLNDVQRSFLKTDLPYRPVSPKPKFQKIKNTPFSLPIEIDSIQPAVDSGVSNYYGK